MCHILEELRVSQLEVCKLCLRGLWVKRHLLSSFCIRFSLIRSFIFTTAGKIVFVVSYYIDLVKIFFSLSVLFVYEYSDFKS
jgi:hypothetical protein